MMIIGIPVDNNSIEANMSTNFGRAKFFLVHDTENGENDFVENTAAQDSSGAGIKAAQIILDNDVEAIIVPQLGVKAFDLTSSPTVR